MVMPFFSVSTTHTKIEREKKKERKRKGGWLFFTPIFRCSSVLAVGLLFGNNKTIARARETRKAAWFPILFFFRV
jgi:hypothetical protein